MARCRIRDLGIQIGGLPTGEHNAITDVPGVLIGHATLIRQKPRVARTGVTVILPRAGWIREDHAFAGFHCFNGNGEMTGILWLEESGLLGSMIALTNTHQVGVVRDALVRHAVEVQGGKGFMLPVVGETYDGWLNDIDAFHLTEQDVFKAIESATSGPVVEGNVGGGTGMICHDFKGGIGTSSRLVDCPSGRFTLGALVQSNYGSRSQLRIDGVPVGTEINLEEVPSPWTSSSPGGSILIILATDAPLLAVQCRRLAQRATAGLARVGGVGHNGSGDLFLAFATGNHIPYGLLKPLQVRMLPHPHLDAFFEAAADVVEESILNALAMAETMTGFQDRTAYAMPLDRVQEIVARHGRRTADG
jgi:D-aminopeptidase